MRSMENAFAPNSTSVAKGDASLTIALVFGHSEHSILLAQPEGLKNRDGRRVRFRTTG
jgi:hypothetical protein